MLELVALFGGLIVGLFLGLVAGAAFARSDLRAMSADLADLRAELDRLRSAASSDASASAGRDRAPTHAEGR